MMSLAPVPSEPSGSSTCANCGAPLVADQRYCLSCGQPASPVRLAFLDVLETERTPQLGAGSPVPVPGAYSPYAEPAVGPAWVRRYAPLFAVLAVLLLALVVGLLVGHWVTQSKAPAGAEVVRVEGLGGVAAGTAGAASTTPATRPPSRRRASRAPRRRAKKKRKRRKQRRKKRPKKKTPAKALRRQISAPAVTKPEHYDGKTHEQELNKLTTAPIEVK